MRSWCALAVALTAGVSAARAENGEPRIASGTAPAARTPSREISGSRRALAITAAIVPGILVRGAGSWVAHEKPVAKKLLLVAGGGVLLAGIAGGLVGGTGGNPATVPAIPVVTLGAGVILTTWIADIWTAAGGDRLALRPRAVAPWSIEAGSTWHKDAYRGRLLGRVGARVAAGRADLATTMLAHVGGDSWVSYGSARLRLLGAAPARIARAALDTPDDPLLATRRSDDEIGDGTRLGIRVGGRLQRDDEDRTSQRVAELEVEGRLDLARIDDVLHGTFVEGATGLGALHVSYSDDASELDSILLARFAWGMYLPTGEAALYYDHRRDGLAGGIAAGRAAGFMGSIGAVLDIGLVGPWGVHGELQFGNAWLSTLALSYRGGR